MRDHLSGGDFGLESGDALWHQRERAGIAPLGQWRLQKLQRMKLNPSSTRAASQWRAGEAACSFSTDVEGCDTGMEEDSPCESPSDLTIVDSRDRVHSHWHGWHGM